MALKLVERGLLGERPVPGSACPPAGRSLNDIRETRALSQQAQDLRDRAAMIALLRNQARMGIRYVA